MNKNLAQSNTYQAIWVGLGSLTSFAFTIISAAVLSRFLSKTEYGTYKQVMYVYNTLLVIFTLGLPKTYAYFLPRYGIEYGNSIVNKLNKIFFLIGFAFSLLLYFGAPVIADVLNNHKLISSLKLFAIAPTFILPTMGIEGIMSTYKKNYINAIYVVISRLLMLTCVVTPVALYKADSDTAIIGFSISSFLTCCIGLYIKKVPYRGISKKKTDLSYKEIFRFSVPLMFASIGGIAIKSADQFYVSRFFGTEVFADFANGSVDLPFVGMILGAAATILLPEFSRSLANGSKSFEPIADLWSRTAVKSAMILYPLIIYCLFFSSEIMSFLYGGQYCTSAVYFSIILIVDLFTIAPYYPIIIAFGATDYYAKVHLAMAVAVWGCEYLCVLLFKSPISIAMVSAIFHVIKVIIMSKFVADRLETRLLKLFPLKELLKITLFSALCCFIPFILVEYVFEIHNLLFKLSLSCVAYGMLLLFASKLFKLDYISIVKPLLYKIKR